MSYKLNKPTTKELKKWTENKLVNPRTCRKIKENGPIYKLLNFYLNEIHKPVVTDTYQEYRSQNIDPILMIELPIEGYTNNKFFKFKYKWNPYTGEREEKDKNGCLSFDPDTLIHFYYTNRLNHLWESSTDMNFSGHFGDAMGNGPDFEIKGRGKHPDWYLFRLPIVDCYVNEGHCQQAVTMGPILTDKEIREIDRLSKKYKNNYKNKFKTKRPSLVKMKKLYDIAINKNPILDIDNEVLPYVDPLFIKKLKYNINVKAIEQLLKI
jgi:hypothetical protein